MPEKVWTGRDVSYNHLRVFGCRAFVLIPRDERSKLDSKTKECIFLGYGHEEFGYRLWDPVNKKIIRSRDVVFFEEQTIEDFDKPEKPKSINSEQFHSDLTPTPMTYSNDEGDAQGDQQNAIDMPPVAHELSDTGEPTENVDENPSEPEIRRSTRERQPSKRYSPHEYVLLSDGGEPQTYQEVMSDTKKNEWLKAMQEEMRSLRENHTYDLVKLPKGKRVLKNKWVFRLKTEEMAHNQDTRQGLL